MYIIFVFPIVSCTSFFNGTVPVKTNSASSSAIAFKLSTPAIIARVYFKKDNVMYKTEKFGDYYILFNALPGKYVLSHGESIDDKHLFPTALIDACTVTMTGNEMAYLGDFSLSVAKEDIIYKDVPLMLFFTDFNREEERTDYYYKDPVKKDKDAAFNDFVRNMGDALLSKGWDAGQFQMQ
jgi:hypothetical protein